MARKITATPTDSLSVSIGSLGGIVSTVLLAEGACVADALAAANFPANSEVRCNGEVYSGSDLLDDGDSLMVLAGTKVAGA